ncbi:MAG: EamA family transporter [Paracoccaceae bacterium]
MSFGILLAVLGAALLHASWNALLKIGPSKRGTMLVLSLTELPIGLAIAATRPFPAAEVWPWVLASGTTHLAYKLFLLFAYDHGDLSRVYPIARGTAPMLVLIVSALFLSDRISPAEYAGIAAIGAGILVMAGGVFRSGESRRLVPLALGSALATAVYTLLDGQGARVSGDAVAYVAWVFVADGLIFSTAILTYAGRPAVPSRPRDWAMGAAASVASYASYAIAVWAMTAAPIALVAALRETSILFAVLIGWLVFGDRMSRGKWVAVALIVAGVFTTRL